MCRACWATGRLHTMAPTARSWTVIRPWILAGLVMRRRTPVRLLRLGLRRTSVLVRTLGRRRSLVRRVTLGLRRTSVRRLTRGRLLRTGRQRTLGQLLTWSGRRRTPVRRRSRGRLRSRGRRSRRGRPRTLGRLRMSRRLGTSGRLETLTGLRRPGRSRTPRRTWTPHRTWMACLVRVSLTGRTMRNRVTTARPLHEAATLGRPRGRRPRVGRLSDNLSSRRTERFRVATSQRAACNAGRPSS
jgi:hypothetical protein